jgi:hypothetical protein
MMDEDFFDEQPEPYENDLEELGNREAFEDSMADREAEKRVDYFNAEVEVIEQDFQDGLISEKERRELIAEVKSRFVGRRNDESWDQWAHRHSEGFGPEHDLPDEPAEQPEF